MPSLEWTPVVERATAHLYERVKNVISPVEWPLMAPYVKAINKLKQARDAVILAHNYQTPENFHCVADIGGDSLQLAVEASKVKSDIIVRGFIREILQELSLPPELACGRRSERGGSLFFSAEDRWGDLVFTRLSATASSRPSKFLMPADVQ